MSELLHQWDPKDGFWKAACTCCGNAATLSCVQCETRELQSKLAVMQTECYENRRMRAALDQICEATDHPDFEAAVETVLSKLEQFERTALALAEQLDEAQTARVSAESRLETCQKTVAFFASVIRSGESWSADCQYALDECAAPDAVVERHEPNPDYVPQIGPGRIRQS